MSAQWQRPPNPWGRRFPITASSARSAAGAWVLCTKLGRHVALKFLPDDLANDSPALGGVEEANDILALMMRQWNTIAGTIFKGEVYMPLLLENEDSIEHRNDWARGFIWGMGVRHDGWA